MPFSLKVLLENLLRNEDGRRVTADDICALAAWDPGADPTRRSGSPRTCGSSRSGRCASGPSQARCRRALVERLQRSVRRPHAAPRPLYGTCRPGDRRLTGPLRGDRAEPADRAGNHVRAPTSHAGWGGGRRGDCCGAGSKRLLGGVGWAAAHLHPARRGAVRQWQDPAKNVEPILPTIGSIGPWRDALPTAACRAPGGMARFSIGAAGSAGWRGRSVCSHRPARRIGSEPGSARSRPTR